MKINLKFQDKTVTATLIDNETSRDFVSLLPLTMNDLFRREKFAHLPRAISEGGKRTHTYEVGDLIYWSPGPDLAVFYRHDGQRIPNPGIIVIGKVDAGVDALDVPGAVKVKVGQELAPKLDPESPYREWVETYASAEMAGLVSRLEALLDRYGGNPDRLAWLYRRAMELELAFFQAAWEAT